MFLALAHARGTSRLWYGWGGWGGGDVNVRCTCTHLGATQLMFLALANISVLRNWCFLHLHTRTWHVTSLVWVGWVGGGGDVNVRCTCTHLGATQLMFLALANISVLRNWCFLHLHTRTWHVTSLVWVGWVGGGGMLTYVALAHISVLRNWCFLHLQTSRYCATDVSCTCTHARGTSRLWYGWGGWGGGGGMLTYVALAHISVLRNWCFLHLHTSRCYATDVSCTCKHLGTAQLMFLALARISVLRNWCFLHLHTVVRVSNNVRVSLEQAVDVTWTMDAL